MSNPQDKDECLEITMSYRIGPQLAKSKLSDEVFSAVCMIYIGVLFAVLLFMLGFFLIKLAGYEVKTHRPTEQTVIVMPRSPFEEEGFNGFNTIGPRQIKREPRGQERTQKTIDQDI